MAHLFRFSAILLAFVVCSAAPVADDVKGVDLRMPDVRPQVADTYLCVPMKMDKKATYITGFTPHANMATAHHMLLFGCDEPGSGKPTWSCGEMESDVYGEQKPVCASVPKIIYAWAMDAPELILPEDVAFEVGGDSGIKWLVLQVHYKDVTHFTPPENGEDHSGITLHTTSTPQPKLAGVYLLSTGGAIPAESTTYMEAACGVSDDVIAHPFAYRVHAHVHGEVVSGYRVRDGVWSEIGRMSPKKPQMFYNVTTPGLTVENGDILAARCTMVNKENRTVQIGETQKDEMCNFYMMYWVAGQHLLREDFCNTEGPPFYSWSKVSTIHAENSPVNASIIPGTDKLLKASTDMVHKVNRIIADTHSKINEDLLELLGEVRGQGESLDDMMYPENSPDKEASELKELNDMMETNKLPSYELQNEIGGYDPEDFRSEMFGGYQPEVGRGVPYEDWFEHQVREEEYSPYEDDDGRPYYPQY